MQTNFPRIAMAGLVLMGLMMFRNDAAASGIQTEIRYSTSATIGTVGHTGPDVIHFAGLDGASLMTGQEASLGSFSVDAPTNGVTGQYNGTPFEIDLQVLSIDGKLVPTDASSQVAIHGWIGSGLDVSGAMFSTITIDQNGPQPTDDMYYHPSAALLLDGSRLLIYPNLGNFFVALNSGGVKSIPLRIDNPVPEPATSWMFVLGALSITARLGYQQLRRPSPKRAT